MPLYGSVAIRAISPLDLDILILDLAGNFESLLSIKNDFLRVLFSGKMMSFHSQV